MRDHEGKVTSDTEARTILEGVTTATIPTILLEKGLRNVWIRGARAVRTGQRRLVGKAFTLRFVPARDDLATPASWASPISTRAAIEAMPEGVVVPAALMDEVCAEAPEQERMEAWIISEVDRGTPLPGLYPMNEATKARDLKTKESGEA